MTNYCFFRYDLPWDLLNNPFVKYTILPVVLWDVNEINVNKPVDDMGFGTPVLLYLPQGRMSFNKLYDEICERLVRNCGFFKKANSRISYDYYSLEDEIYGKYNHICFYNNFIYKESQLSG